MEALKTKPGAIVLVGFMAAGKSNAAREVADHLGTEALDADALIEADLGTSIPTFFEREGEDEFRRREEKLVLELLSDGRGDDRVIALGGGAIESEAVRRALDGHVVVWCAVDEETAWERAQGGGRPLAADRDEFSRRFSERQPLYESVATAVLPAAARDAAKDAAPWIAALRQLPQARLAWAASASASYPAVIGPGAIGLLSALDPDRRRFCIADRQALVRHEDLLPSREATIQVEGGEERKTLTEAEVLLRSLAEMKVRRDDSILAFGGGVAGDLAGFVAATYQRGTPVVQLPTTVVAQVDSAYGGKTGVDLPEAKNYVGAYHLPSAVLADPSVLATLPGEEISAGFVEVLKTALIAGGSLWDEVSGLDFIPLVRAGASEELTGVIFACARTKLEVVAADERDSGRRAVLNLGHTVGHAIEAATGYRRYRHGEAVALGLLAALRLSGAEDLRAQVRGILEAHALPTTLDQSVAVDSVEEALALDKKNLTAAGLGFVLLERPGEPRWGEEVAPDRVRDAVEELQR